MFAFRNLLLVDIAIWSSVGGATASRAVVGGAITVGVVVGAICEYYQLQFIERERYEDWVGILLLE